MRPVPTRIHGILDYATGLLLIVAPWLLNFAWLGVETWVPVAMGCAVILYSLLTAYELGVAPVIDMRAHLWLDVVGGLFLAVSPWLFNFDEIVWVPHVTIGVFEVFMAAITQTVPVHYPRRMVMREA